MEWELSKENVLPLKEGRNVEKLNAGLRAKVEAPLKSKISQEHRKMVEAIDAYRGDDPLKPWIECIRWVKQAYPSGGSQSRLLPLLELCVRTFCKDLRYADDIRYLKVWMEYADRCSNPQEIYTFLQDNNIGQKHAQFYEHCGRYWEQQQKLSKAKSIYDLGIARKAQPLDSLKKALQMFLLRATAENSTKDETMSQPPLTNPSRAFGTTIAGQTRGPISQRGQTFNAVKSNKGMQQQFSVFVDMELRTGVSNQRAESMRFNPEAEKNKENIQRASKWAGVKVPHLRKATAASDFKLDVFRDEEPTKQTVDTTKKIVPASKLLRLDDLNGSTSEEDKLKRNPLVYFEDDDDDMMDLILI